MNNGYAGARMEPIASEARVSTATLYALYDGKDELFKAVIEDSAVDFNHLMSNLRMTTGTARERLTHFADTYAGFMADPFIHSIFVVLIGERGRFKELAVDFFDRGRSDFSKVLSDTLIDLTQQGQLQIRETSWAADQMMGMIQHPAFFVPLVNGSVEAGAERCVGQIAAEAVETFLARYAPTTHA